jgi:hypothetical protein
MIAIHRFGPIALPGLLAAIAAVGWSVGPVGWSVAIAVQMALAGFGTALLLGPVRPSGSYARYATLAVAALSASLAGRLLPSGAAIILTPAIWLYLWWLLHVEIGGAEGSAGRLALDLTMVLAIFGGSAGIMRLVGPSAWPPPMVLIGLVAAVPAWRTAEARGARGAKAAGQTLLHLLAIVEVGLALTLLDLPPPVLPALVALAFHTWNGAADALLANAPARSVLLEFGTLAVLGVLVVLILTRV